MFSVQSLKREFEKRFNVSAGNASVFFSPGRLCLIGEHIDYNGGLVLPAAISRGIYAVFKPETNAPLTICSGLDERIITIRTDEEITFKKENGWGNYPAGVIEYLRKNGKKIQGGKLLLLSNLPVGAGLSSSAAVEALTAFVCSGGTMQPDERLHLVKLCKAVENNFVGVNCGIMDQFAVVFGKKEHALLLDCDTLACAYIPFKTEQYDVVIINTNKKRELTESIFNQRVSECAAALNALQAESRVTHLAEANEESVLKLVNDAAPRKRALHVVRENARVKAAADALKKNDFRLFGSLLTASHESLRDYYEVTGHELDSAVEAAVSHPACLGAKMSGAGFGGCAFALVEKAQTENFIRRVSRDYTTKTGLTAACFSAQTDDGVRQLE